MPFIHVRTNVEAPDIGYVQLSDLSQKKALTEALNAEYGDMLQAREFEPGAYMADLIRTVDSIMQAIILTVYIVSLVFAAIVVTMICKRSFQRERTDIGIFRAMGFSVPHLRRQFAMRFLLIALIATNFGNNNGMAIIVIPVALAYADQYPNMNMIAVCMSIALIVFVALMTPAASPYCSVLHGRKDLVNFGQIARTFMPMIIVAILAYAFIGIHIANRLF